MIQDNNENILKGTLGAILGSIIGLILIVLFSNLGIVASVSGYVMAIFTFKYYKKFSNYISKNGLIVCIIIMIIMTFFAHNFSIALDIFKAQIQAGNRSNYFYIFINIFNLIKNNYINLGYYLSKLILLYLFMIIGSFTVIANTYKNVN